MTDLNLTRAHPWPSTLAQNLIMIGIQFKIYISSENSKFAANLMIFAQTGHFTTNLAMNFMNSYYTHPPENVYNSTSIYAKDED